jgi:transcriptional regulator of NAD metabolism
MPGLPGTARSCYNGEKSGGRREDGGVRVNTEARRRAVVETLRAARQPVSAAALAEQFSVSRQIIVGDIALLRAGGADISATPRGYVLGRKLTGLIRQVAVRHGMDAMEAELNAMVDQGCTVVDVIVEHPIYGQLTGPLQLSNRHDVDLVHGALRAILRRPAPLRGSRRASICTRSPARTRTRLPRRTGTRWNALGVLLVKLAVDKRSSGFSGMIDVYRCQDTCIPHYFVKQVMK